MKKFGMLLGSIILASALVACGEKKEEAKTEAPAAEKLSIGLTAYKFDDNFIALFRKAFEAEAMAKADTVEVTGIDSQNSVATEKEQIEAVLEKGVKAFAINLVDASAADGIINLLKEKLKKYTMPPALENLEIKVGVLGNEAGIKGAVALFI